MANTIFRPVDYTPIEREDPFAALEPPIVNYENHSENPSPRSVSPRPAPPARRQSALAHPRPDGTPRTSNRVRFDMDQALHVADADGNADGQRSQSEYMMEGKVQKANGKLLGQRAPLLTDMDAQSGLLACDDDDDDDENGDVFDDDIFNPEELLESARPKSGMKSAFMNMANSIIGAGIIGQPYAFRQAGLITGAFLLVALTIVVDWTIGLIVINTKLSGTNSFQTTMQHCFGRPGLIAISLAQWAFAFGGMIAFCIIVGDTIPHVMIGFFPSLEDMHFLWLLTNRQGVIVIFILGISFPLSLYRDIAKLAKASTLALISMGVIIVTVLVEGPQTSADRRGPIKGSIFMNNGVFQAIGVISFAFVCHHNSLLIYGSLRRPTIDRFARVTHYSTGISMVACLAMAMAGFLTFGDKTQGNVLNNFPSDNLMVNIARLCFGLNMLTTLPLECFVCREVMLEYFYPDQPFHRNRHLIITSALVVSATAVALLTCDVGAVFEIIGATSACALAYIMPPLCYIKLSTRSWKTVAAWICVVFGFVVMAISLVQSIYKIVTSEGSTATCG